MTKPIRKRRTDKPDKPRADFPLFPHRSGYWAKKVRGRFVYFGKVADDPEGEAALNLWLDQKNDLLAGRTPRAGREGLVVKDLCNRFLSTKDDLLTAAELSPRTFGELYATCAMVVKAFGPNRLADDLAADDFEALRRSMAKTWGPVRLGNEIQRVRSLFRYGFEASLMDKPVRFGPSFRKPTRKTMRIHRAAKGPKMFEPAELLSIIDATGVPLKAMVLLGVNCGFGAADVAGLPITALDLKGGWADFPRPKTGVLRRCPLWPETIRSVQDAMSNRPEPKAQEHSGLVFITKYKRPWQRTDLERNPDNGDVKLKTDSPVAKEFRKVLVAMKLHKPGLGFYTLRHVFETVGGEAKDQVAVNAIMGHVDETMAGTYRERISDDRLQAVVNHVHDWLFGKAETK